ncbi:uncharacterized protein [Periplaneta americana]|uniref:uncharacterized protein n=1 Tax=Periplaneta americana TaxID=6978 RepID=UPI0037E8109F
MAVSYANLSLVLRSSDDIKQERLKQHERFVLNKKIYAEEMAGELKLLIALDQKKVQPTTLKQEFTEAEVNISTLKKRELGIVEDIKFLESDILCSKKKIAVANEEEQQLLARKKKAETEKENFEKDVVKMHDTFVKALAYYKKKLNIRLRFKENEQLIVHFLDIPAHGDDLCSVTVAKENDKWKLIETNPALPCEKKLARQLETTEDTQGLLHHVRTLFVQLSSREAEDGQHKIGKKISKKS